MASFPRLRSLALSAAILAAAVLPASAQRVDPRRIIDFHLNAEDRNVSFDGSVVEGGRFHLTFQDGSGTYALAVVQLDAARKLYGVTVFRGGGEGDTTTYRALETVHATLNVPTPLTSLPRWTVVIEGTRAVQAAATSVPRFNLASYTRRLTGTIGFRCCVFCGGVGACGCAVSADCGSCCEAPCCDNSPAPPPGGGMAQYFPDRPLQKTGRRCKEVPVSERIYPATSSGERIASR